MPTGGLLDLLDVGVIVHRVDSSIAYANDAACRMLGLSRDEVLARTSRSSWDIRFPDGAEVRVEDQPAMRVLASGTAVHGTVLGVLQPNLADRSWLRVDAVPIHGADGRLERVLVSFTDVSHEHRRVTEAHLARVQSEERHASVLRAMNEGVVVHDPTGAIIFSNPAAERILGLTSAQLRGVEGVDPRWALVLPDGSPVAPDAVPSERTRLTGQPCHDVVLGVHRANGGQAWLAVSTDAFSGEGRSVVATFTDITEQRETQLALERAHARFSAVTSAIPGVLYQTVLGGDGSLTMAFVAGETDAIVGLSPEAIMEPSFNVAKLIHPDDARDAMKRLAQDPSPKAVHHAVFRLRRGNEWRWARARATAAATDAGLLFTGVIVDITEERRLADGLERAQRREAMGDLAAGIAHNFNNMLAAALPNLTELRDHVAPAGRVMLDEALSATERAADLVQQLMRLARGDGAPEQRAFDARTVLLDVATLCKRTFDRGVEVHVDVPDAGPVVTRGNATQLHQTLVNLCLNARDALAGRPKPALRLSLEATEGTLPGRLGPQPLLAVTVQDNGTGMDEATLRHIGEPFFTTKAPGKGTGLGLASAMRVVREAGGELSVDSAVGIGTTFRITLPAYNDDVTPDGSPVEKQAASIGAILLVEDEPLVRKAIARVLQRLTPHVEAVEDGTRAIALLSDDPRPKFDLVLLDLSMPGIPGRRVLADIAARDPKLPVIIMSGNVGDREGLEHAAAIIEKPVTPSQLEQVIATVLARARA